MNKLSRIFILFAMILGGSMVSMNAQTAEEVDASNKRMLSASTPSNKGPEAFKDFIAQFSTDPEFMESRLKLTPDQRGKFAEAIVPSEFTAKAPFQKGDDEWYQMWGELQYNKAYLMCGWVDSFVEYTFEFTRQNGKWYLSNIVAEE